MGRESVARKSGRQTIVLRSAASWKFRVRVLLSPADNYCSIAFRDRNFHCAKCNATRNECFIITRVGICDSAWSC